MATPFDPEPNEFYGPCKNWYGLSAFICDHQENFNITYKFVELNPSKGETTNSDFLRLNPEAYDLSTNSRKVPVLVANSTQKAYTESWAIQEFLALSHPEAALLPTNPGNLPI